jgi:hypothetical protein
MTRIGDRGFLFAWQTIRAATQPNSEATTWQFAGVRWWRHRYSQTAPDHAVSIEVHRLDYTGRGDTWSLMVVQEHWWDGQHKPLRNSLWATHISGSRERIVEWIDREARLFDPSRGRGPEPDQA